MNDLQNARELLTREGYTCVLCRGEEIFADRRRGVKPLLELLETGKDFSGFAAADKVVGKAAAHLYCLLGVKTIHAGVISQRAWRVLEENGVAISFDKEVPAIQNRTQTGLCPMESAVWDIPDHKDAHAAILRTLENLQTK